MKPKRLVVLLLLVMAVAYEPAWAQRTITIPCSRLQEFLDGTLDVPPDVSVKVTAHTYRSLMEAAGGPEQFAAAMRTREGRAAIESMRPIADEEFEWCQQRAQAAVEARRRQRSDAVGALAVIPFTPGKPIHVDVRVNRLLAARLILDTGADRTMIAPRFLRAAGLSPGGTATVGGVAGLVHVQVYEIESLEVGQAKVGSLMIFGHDTAELGADGLLGRDFLDHFTVLIDNTTQQVTLRRRSKS
jgi:hypothetical protein